MAFYQNFADAFSGFDHLLMVLRMSPHSKKSNTLGLPSFKLTWLAIEHEPGLKMYGPY